MPATLDLDSLKRTISKRVAGYPSQSGTQTRWREPIVGVAAASDPLFARFKEVVRPSHCTPRELLPGAESVVTFFIPFAAHLHRDNAAGPWCSRSWAVAYVETNRLIGELSDHLRAVLERAGWRAAAVPPTHNFDEQTLMSDWSHRHAAYAAGIGRFGVHNLLITEAGCSGRLGSLITDMPLLPSPAQEGEFCLHKAGYKCLKCVQRCRYGALFPDRFDRHACYRQCLANASRHPDVGLADVCGKCASLVPCSVRNPVRSTVAHSR